MQHPPPAHYPPEPLDPGIKVFQRHLAAAARRIHSAIPLAPDLDMQPFLILIDQILHNMMHLVERLYRLKPAVPCPDCGKPTAPSAGNTDDAHADPH